VLTAKAIADTEQVKILLKEIAGLSGKVKTLQHEIETEREKRQEVEARLQALEQPAEEEGEEEVVAW
jgi:hypothetical protein